MRLFCSTKESFAKTSLEPITIAKHLKGHSAPRARVSHVTFLLKGLSGQPVSHVTFLINRSFGAARESRDVFAEQLIQGRGARNLPMRTVPYFHGPE